jgi:transposase-like protein
MTEQRYRAVLEVQAGVAVTEVADRFGVSWQAVHRWLRRYAGEGLGGLADRPAGRVPHQDRPRLRSKRRSASCAGLIRGCGVAPLDTMPGLLLPAACS